jgi:hypothetical protein
MQEHLHSRAFSQCIIETIRQVLGSESFCDRHKRRPEDFTRQRHFCFMRTLVFLLQKTVRSVQLHLHEFFDRLGEPCPLVTASAWSQARLKLGHTAFIELNHRAILEPVYAAGSAFAVKRWRVKSWSKFVTSATAEVTTYIFPRSGSLGWSATGVAPTGAGLPNHSSRLLSCAWVPVAGQPGGAGGPKALTQHKGCLIEPKLMHLFGPARSRLQPQFGVARPERQV